MNPHDNLPPHQRPIQRLIDQFNADERWWWRLEAKRVRRRKRDPHLSAESHKLLDLLECANARPPQDCIGSA